MYDCPNQCVPRRAFFSDGEEMRSKPDPCPSCESPLTRSIKDENSKMITTHTCPKCGYTDVDEYEWSAKEDEKPDEAFATDRDRFCLTRMKARNT